MKREFLTGLGIEANVVDQIMTENGKDIEGLKAQLGVQKGLVTDLTGQLNTANGELTKKLNVKANAFSAAAKEKIEALGGTCEVI